MTAALVGILVVEGLSIAHPQSDLSVNEQDFAPTAIAARAVAVTTTDEYQPVWATSEPRTSVAERLTVETGSAAVLSERDAPTAYRVVVDVAQPTQVRVNTYYFPGWTLTVDGAPQPLQFGSADGLMRFALAPGRHDVAIAFIDTPVRARARALSLLSLAALLLSPLFGWALRPEQARPAVPDRQTPPPDAEEAAAADAEAPVAPESGAGHRGEGS